MKKYAQCLMCKYVLGRSCKLTKQLIPDEIYSNEKQCESFKALDDDGFSIDDPCCCENSRYYEQVDKK